MLTYERLDSIADAYVPLLLILLMAFNAAYLSKHRNIKPILAAFFLALTSVVLVYVIGFVDGYYELWSRYNLDYSTHTALSLVLVVSIVPWLRPSIRIAVIMSFVFYIFLMRYQQYHTWLDMFSTIAVLMPLVITTFLQRARLFKALPSFAGARPNALSNGA